MTTLNLAVAASSDDAEQTSGGTTDIDNAEMAIQLDGTGQWAGLRFLSVTIPQAATINSATLTVEPISTTADEPLVTIFAEAADNAATFAATSNNIVDRTETTASVSWSSTDLGASGTSRHSPPSLAAPVQEVINRAGWASGNALAILIQGGSSTTRDLAFKMYDSSSADAATLDIDYTASSFVPRLSLLGVG